MRRLAVIIAMVILAACSASSSDEGESANPVALVSLARASSGSVPETVTIFGAADPGPAGTQTVSATAESILVSVVVPVGSRVGRGQVIARMRSSPASRLELARAAMEAGAASRAYARQVRLRRDGLASDADVESARAAATAAGATVRSLRSRTGDTALVSPISGTVTQINAAPGTVLAAGSPVATVTSAEAVRARFGVDPTIARRIAAGAFIRVSPADGGAGFSVPVQSVDPSVDPQTRLASIYAPLPSRAQLGSGEALRGEIVIPHSGSEPIIPYAALLNDGGKPFVFVVVKGIARRRNVMVGATSAKVAEIRSGISAGEIVVTAGGTALEDGMKVRTK